MKSRALVIFLIFIILFAFASAALLNALRFEHCESTLSFILLYVPLFFVNNVFVTLSAFVYWIVAEKKQTTVNRRIATRALEQPDTLGLTEERRRACPTDEVAKAETRVSGRTRVHNKPHDMLP